MIKEPISVVSGKKTRTTRAIRKSVQPSSARNVARSASASQSTNRPMKAKSITSMIDTAAAVSDISAKTFQTGLA